MAGENGARFYGFSPEGKPLYIGIADAVSLALPISLTPNIIADALTAFRNSLPPLPENDADIPNTGGWFRNGLSFAYVPPKV